MVSRNDDLPQLDQSINEDNVVQVEPGVRDNLVFRFQPDAVNINKMILTMTFLILATTVSKTVSGPTQPTRGAVRLKRRVAIPR